MTRDEVIQMAQEAGFNWPEIHTTTVEERLERFAELVAEAERERVIKAVSAAICARGKPGP